MVLDDRLGDGRCGEIQALANLLLEEAHEAGEKLLGLVLNGQATQLDEPVAHDAPDLPLASQAGIVGEGLGPLTPAQEAGPQGQWHALKQQEPWPQHQRRPDLRQDARAQA